MLQSDLLRELSLDPMFFTYHDLEPWAKLKSKEQGLDYMKTLGYIERAIREIYAVPTLSINGWVGQKRRNAKDYKDVLQQAYLYAKYDEKRNSE